MYITVSYKQDWVDTCRGCVMDTFGSDLKIYIWPNKEQALRKIANIDWERKEHYTHDTTYDHFIFDLDTFNNNINEFVSTVKFIDCAEFDAFTLSDVDLEYIGSIKKELDEEKAQKERENKEKQQRDRDEAIKRNNIAKEQEERDTYAKLKAKFEG